MSMWADLFRRWRRSEAGNVAMIFALALPVLIVAGGAALDLQRASVARSAAQDAADAAVLAAAASRTQDLGAMTGVVRNYLVENLDDRYLDGQPVSTVDRPREAHVRVRLEGAAPTMFLGLIGIAEMPVVVSATATRGAAEEIELALVLDNTWSMSDRDASGTRKIDALKSAARLLVNELMQDGGGKVRVAVVPYADYVNVGTSNRSQPWVSVPADYSTTSARTCQTITSERRCTRGAPRTCTRYVDGVRESYDCTPSTCTNHPVTPYERCTGGGTTRYRWYGCVASRTEGIMRLNDSQPQKPYPGLLSTSQNCLTPITPLTDRRNTVLSAIDALIVNVGGYRPLTYIPSGLIWGVNTLSPTAPFTDGDPYDAANRKPRKILVLMTDGENTLRFDPSSGRHVTPSTNGNSGAQQLRATNDDTAAICDYARAKDMEVFTVALAVGSTTARNLLEDCATDADHYFDARDTAALRDSFAAIAASINRVRLVE
ncbi:vWA domain-containing protein [Brevundimonas viscosa]|uniref:Flp pilus assembly protein TadG n=1 Tax=Brevundimonas viscosa TaxID=871741 RepID=A0A1I6TCA8_9CAUL|nr:VWA domain-containing protein [Brevundimonas viscosa]SFS86839.1 Flp pilus assembly protein TadG [Brevundimonas viscosa]